MSSTTEYPPQGGVCEKCGMATEFDEEGRTCCSGCHKSTEHCACEAK